MMLEKLMLVTMLLTSNVTPSRNANTITPEESVFTYMTYKIPKEAACGKIDLPGGLPFKVHVFYQTHEVGEIFPREALYSQLQIYSLLKEKIQPEDITTLIVEGFSDQPEEINTANLQVLQRINSYLDRCEKNSAVSHSLFREAYCLGMKEYQFLRKNLPYLLLHQRLGVALTGFEHPEDEIAKDYDTLIRRLAQGDPEAIHYSLTTRSHYAIDKVLEEGKKGRGNVALVIGAAHRPIINRVLSTYAQDQHPTLIAYDNCPGKEVAETAYHRANLLRQMDVELNTMRNKLDEEQKAIKRHAEPEGCFHKAPTRHGPLHSMSPQ